MKICTKLTLQIFFWEKPLPLKCRGKNPNSYINNNYIHHVL